MRNIKILLLLLFAVFLFNCRTIQYVPIESETKIEYRDTTIYKDSVVYVPKEVVKDVTSQLDTLKMETSMAKAKAWVDTTNNVLRGHLENKQGIQYKYVYKDKIVMKDTIITKEVPVPVDKIVKVVPKWCYFTAILSTILICLLIVKIYNFVHKV